MKNLFDKLEQSSIFVRLGIVLFLVVVLISGFIFVKPTQKTGQSTKIVSYSRRSSSSKAGSSSNASSDSTVQEVESAVKKLEEEQTAENLSRAQEAVDKVKDEAVKEKLQSRIQAVRDAMSSNQAPTDSSEPVLEQQQSASPAAPVYRSPAVSTETPSQPQENPSPAPSSNPEPTPSPSSATPNPSTDAGSAPQPSSGE